MTGFNRAEKIRFVRGEPQAVAGMDTSAPAITAHEGPAVALPKVWRLRLFAQELLDCGFDPEKEGVVVGYSSWEIMKKVLIAKGLPDGFTLDRTPVRIKPFDESEHGPGLELEFE